MSTTVRSTMRAAYPDGRPAAAARMDATDEGVVLRHGDVFDALGARDVCVWRHEGRWYMHYDAAGPTGWLAALATSDDGWHWEKHGTVLELGAAGEPDSATASFGLPFFDGGIWHLFYLGSPNATPPPQRVPAFPYRTLKARSRSPAGPWVKQRNVIPLATVRDTYYSVTASPGQIIQSQRDFLQFFSAATEQGGAIRRTLSLATTRDLDAPWSIRATPLLPLQEQVENSSLYYEPENETWFLFTNHVGITPEDGEYTDAIWVYWSRDLMQWNPDHKAVVLDGSNCSWSRRVIGLPSVVRVEDRLMIYYDGLATAGTSHCHRDIGRAWLQLPLQC